MTEISKAAQVANLANEVVSVKDFGAVGDGVTDDTSAIQAALDYWVTTSYTLPSELVIPAGIYLISSPLHASYTSHTHHLKTLNCRGTLRGNNLAANEDVIKFSTNNSFVSTFIINGLAVEDCGLGGSCIVFDGGETNTAEAMYIVAINEPSVRTTNASTDTAGGHGITFQNGFFEASVVSPRVGKVNDSCYGLYFKQSDLTNIVSSVDMLNPNIRGGKHCIYFEGQDFDTDIVGGTLLFAKEEGLFMEATATAHIRGLHVENCGEGASSMASSIYAGIRISGQYIDLKNIRCANSSKMKYGVRVFANKRATISGLHGADTTGLFKKAFLQGPNAQFTVNDLPTEGYEITYGTSVHFDMPSQHLVGTNIGDTNVTLEATDPFSQRYASTLTANRTVTLPTTEWNGLRFQICRTAATAGAFTLDVGGLYTIPADTNGTVTVMGTGTGWKLESVSLYNTVQSTNSATISTGSSGTEVTKTATFSGLFNTEADSSNLGGFTGLVSVSVVRSANADVFAKGLFFVSAHKSGASVYEVIPSSEISHYSTELDTAAARLKISRVAFNNYDLEVDVDFGTGATASSVDFEATVGLSGTKSFSA